MKKYQKLAIAVMGLLLTASMATGISAHAEEIDDCDKIPKYALGDVDFPPCSID